MSNSADAMKLAAKVNRCAIHHNGVVFWGVFFFFKSADFIPPDERELWMCYCSTASTTFDFTFDFIFDFGRRRPPDWGTDQLSTPFSSAAALVHLFHSLYGN